MGDQTISFQPALWSDRPHVMLTLVPLRRTGATSSPSIPRTRVEASAIPVNPSNSTGRTATNFIMLLLEVRVVSMDIGLMICRITERNEFG